MYPDYTKAQRTTGSFAAFAAKTELQTQLENPFKGLLASMADECLSMITDIMETRKRVVARILKNDWSQGGAWGYYWDAFYPKGGKRTTDAQLSAWIDRDYLEFGFYFLEFGFYFGDSICRSAPAFWHALP